LLGQSLTRRSLGRSLLAFVNACPAQLGLRPGGGGRSPPSSPTRYYKKKAKFLKVRPHPAFSFPNYRYEAGCRASCEQCLRAIYWGGRGAGTPAPQLPFTALLKERARI